MSKLTALVAFLVTLCSLAGPFAQAGGPVAGPLEVSVQSFTQTAAPGSAVHVGIAVENHAERVSIVTEVRMRVVYADGSVQTIQPDAPGVLGPGDGFVQFVFFPVPTDAPMGTATVRFSAVVTQVIGGQPEGLERPLVASDQATFLVATGP